MESLICRVLEAAAAASAPRGWGRTRPSTTGQRTTLSGGKHLITVGAEAGRVTGPRPRRAPSVITRKRSREP